jgi:hypothetical protein
VSDVLWCDSGVFRNQGSKRRRENCIILSHGHRIFDRGTILRGYGKKYNSVYLNMKKV